MAETPTPPPCTVVITTRDRPSDLRDAITSIFAGSRIPDEIVVVDQSSEPVRLDDLENAGCAVRVIRMPPTGVGTSRNAGIGAAAHDMVVIIDDDETVEQDWLDEMVRTLVAAGERVVASGRVVAAGGVHAADARPISVISDEEPKSFRGRMRRDPLFSGNMGLHRSVWEAVGRFDPSFGPGARYRSASDNEFGYRLLEAGYEIRYVPTATVQHRAWRRGTVLRRVNWDYGFGQGAFYAKYASLHDPEMILRLGDLLRERLLWILTRRPRNRSIWGHGDLIYTAAVLTGFGLCLFDRATGRTG